MKKSPATSGLFVDIGGVLGTNGWDHHIRARAVQQFNLDAQEMESRHHLTFDTYEEGKLTLEEYLKRVVFHARRTFSPAEFRRFMFAQSQPDLAMIGLIGRLKKKHGLKIVVVSNEGRELNAHRIRKFKLAGMVDAFVSSCFVHIRKPDTDIYRLALDIAQTPAPQVIYLENTAMFARIAERCGIRSILHTDYPSTAARLAAFGLPDDLGDR